MKKEGQWGLGIVLGLGFFARKNRENIATSVSSSMQTKSRVCMLAKKGRYFV